MSNLTLTITKAGLARFTAAQLSGDLDLAVSSIGLTNADFVVAPTLTALPGKFRDLTTISGAQVGDNIVHMTIRDEAEIDYTARGFGLYLADGTLFAVYGQKDVLFEKSKRAAFLTAIDIAFPTGDVGELRFGSTDFLNPPATTTTKGVTRLATEGDVDAGTVGSIAIGAALLKALLAPIRASIATFAAWRIQGAGMITGGGDLSENRVLRLDAATNEEVIEGARGDVVVSPLTLRVADFVRIFKRDHSPKGYRVGSDAFKDCWGAVNVPAGATVDVPFPVVHKEWAWASGSAWDQQDAPPVSIVEMIVSAAGQPPTGFRVRNLKTTAATFYWQSKGV